jgi:hypothetical protein
MANYPGSRRLSKRPGKADKDSPMPKFDFASTLTSKLVEFYLRMLAITLA